jgi:CHAD domain-containing protein
MKNWEKTLAGALHQRWRRYRNALGRCQEKFSERSIHASRIEARRMSAQLSLLRVFAARRDIERAQEAIKNHLDTFDPLRDAHVQLATLKTECRHIAGAKQVRKFIRKREGRCQRKAEHRIQRVKTRAVREVVDELVAGLRERGKNPERMRVDRGKILRSVDATFARVAMYRSRMDAADPASIHRTRVAFKEFRYMMESMRLLCPQIRRRDLAAMHAFQNLLGDLQDTDVFLDRVDKLIRKKRVKLSEVAPLRRWLMRRHVRQVKLCLRHADVVHRFWPLKSVTVEAG